MKAREYGIRSAPDEDSRGERGERVIRRRERASMNA